MENNHKITVKYKLVRLACLKTGKCSRTSTHVADERHCIKALVEKLNNRKFCTQFQIYDWVKISDKEVHVWRKNRNTNALDPEIAKAYPVLFEKYIEE